MNDRYADNPAVQDFPPKDRSLWSEYPVRDYRHFGVEPSKCGEAALHRYANLPKITGNVLASIPRERTLIVRRAVKVRSQREICYL